MQSKPTLIVYGATSYTAQFLLAYLDSHPQADSFNIILSGRNETKLKDIHAKYPGVADTVAVELSDEKCVHDLVARGDVIVNFAGEASSFVSSIELELKGVQVHIGNTGQKLSYGTPYPNIS